MKTVLKLAVVLVALALPAGCASRVGVSTDHHHIGVGASVR